MELSDLTVEQLDKLQDEFNRRSSITIDNESAGSLVAMARRAAPKMCENCGERPVAICLCDGCQDVYCT